MNFNRSLSEISRRQNAMLRFARVIRVDYLQATCIVQFEEGHQSAPLRWLAQAAGPGETSWHPPNMNEEVLVLAPDGTLETGVILRGLYGVDGKAPPSYSDVVTGVKHADQAFDQYDSQSHIRTIQLVSGGALEVLHDGARFTISESQIKATVGNSDLTIENGQITLNADTITLNGNVKLGGDGGKPIARKGDPVANGKIVDGSSQVESV